jgi:sugar/nucleoside kinase (ribokinase family)
MRNGIVAGGNWIVDRVKVIDAWPAQDCLATILAESTSNGGAPYNVLKDLARLGVPFSLAGVGLVGDDAAGAQIARDCATHGIHTRDLRRVPDMATSFTDVMTDSRTGRRTFFHFRGANAGLRPEHFDFRDRPEKILHLGYLLLLDGLDAFGKGGTTGAAEVLAAARSAGLRTSVDCVSENTDRFQSVVTPVLPHVDYFFANDYEAARLTGSLDSAGWGECELRNAARKILAAGVRESVFLHSADGVCAASREREVWQPAVRVTASRIRGTAGAGDALAAGILFGLHEDWPLEKSLEAGVAAAAVCLTDASCSNAIGPLGDCLVLAHHLGDPV